MNNNTEKSRIEPVLNNKPDSSQTAQVAASDTSVPPPQKNHLTPKKSRWLCWFIRFILLLLILLVVALGGLWVWSGRDGSLAQAVSLAQRFIPIVSNSLQVSDIQGSIRHGGHVGFVRWQQTQIDVQVTNLDFSWDLNFNALLARKLLADHIVIETLQVKVEPKTDTDIPTAPSIPPTYLGLPIQIDLAHWQVNTFIWGEENQGLIITDSAGKYRFEAAKHQLEVNNLNFARGAQQAQATLKATLTANQPQLTAQAQGTLYTAIPASQQRAQIHAALDINGLLTELQINAQVDSPTITSLAVLADGAESNSESTSAAPITATQKIKPSTQQANLQATITPWDTLVVPQVDLTLNTFNINSFWPQAPKTSLTGNAYITTIRNETNDLIWQISSQIKNEMPGAIDQQLLPINSFKIKGNWQNNTATVEQIELLIGSSGVLSAQGQLQLGTPSGSTTESTATPIWEIQATVSNIDPKVIYAVLDSDHINGTVRANQGADLLNYNIELKAANNGGDHTANFRLQHLLARGDWSRQRLKLDELQIKTTYSDLKAVGNFVLPDNAFDEGVELATALQNAVANGKFDLTAPGIEAHAQIASLSGKTGSIQANLQLINAQETLTWIQNIPIVPKSIHSYAASGALSLEAQAQGGWLNPQLNASLNSPLLVLSQKGSENPHQPTELIHLANTEISLNGRLSQAELKAQITAVMNRHTVELSTQAQGGLQGDTIHVEIAHLNTSLYKPTESSKPATPVAPLIHATLEQPVKLSWQSANQRLQIAPGSLALQVVNSADKAPSLIWDQTTWQAGQLNSTGHISKFPVLWLLTLSETKFAGLDISGDLMLEGQWHIRMNANKLDFSIEIARSSGDISLEPEGSAFLSTANERLKAGVRDAQLKIYNTDNTLHAELVWDSEHASIINVIATTSLTRQDGAWTILPSAPLGGQIIAQLPQIGVASALAPTGWRFSGAAILDAEFTGTVSDPGLKGRLSALGVSLRSVLDGIEFVDGNLQMSFDGSRVLMNHFSLNGAGPDGGEMTAQGDIDWSKEKATVNLKVNINKLRASVRSDRQLMASGQITMALQDNQLDINGNLSVDQALIIIGNFGAPTLDSDVVILSPNTQTDEDKKAEVIAKRPPTRAITSRINLSLNLGENFRVQGYGLQTYLEGQLQLSNQGYRPRLLGTITTKNGRFKAYAQNLHVETGTIIFTGPYDNPTLNILAIRPNLPEKVGVQITGTATLPQVRIYSASGLTDSEALSWLVLGRSSSADGAETAALQQAAMALLSGNGPGLTDKLAGSLGIDEISFGGSSNSTASSSGDSLSETTVTISKRFSNNFSVAYEQSLSGATGTLFVFYDISRRLTLRAEAGRYMAMDLIYTFSFDGKK